jgi:hypothetical protein
VEFRVLGQVEALEGDEALKVTAGPGQGPGPVVRVCSGASALGIDPRICAGLVVDDSARRIE